MEKFQAYLNLSALYKSRCRAAESTDGNTSISFSSPVPQCTLFGNAVSQSQTQRTNMLKNSREMMLSPNPINPVPVLSSCLCPIRGAGGS